MKVFCLGGAGRICREAILDLIQFSDFDQITVGDYDENAGREVCDWLNDPRVTFVPTNVLDENDTVAKMRGYEPDSTVCAAQVPAGRPEPWMCLENARNLRVYPLEACVKVDDTLPGIEEGLNAGMWTIGLTKTGNEIGLTEKEIAALPAEDYERRIERAYQRMWHCGAHYVVDGIVELMPCLDDIEARLGRGERP